MIRQRQRGFTLIELMVALVVSSLLVGMILAIFNRMSLAYRGQQQIAGVQQVLAAAHATIEFDAKQAGFGVPQGFATAFDAQHVFSPVRITDSASPPNPAAASVTTPDQIAFFYADASAQALVAGTPSWTPTSSIMTVASTTGFAAADLVVMVNLDTSTQSNPVAPAVDANIVTYTSCAAKVLSVTATTITLDMGVPWGRPGFNQCPSPTANKTMVYKFVARAYRIDPARPAVGALQMSPSGGLFGNANDAWVDIAYGFTDIQTALQVFEPAVGDNADADTDASRNWYSGALQTQRTITDWPAQPGTPPPWPTSYLQMSISLVARTDREVEGVATAWTPELRDPANPNFNTVGNHAATFVSTAPELALQGSHVYRNLTFQVDFRNLGIGR
jgi:prepilin-type N-terminal cleavage/methylation domain-containing protein